MQTASRPADAAAAVHSEKLLFDGGGGESLNGITYHSFRIPSLVRTKSATLLASAEGRASDNRGTRRQQHRRRRDLGCPGRPDRDPQATDARPRLGLGVGRDETGRGHPNLHGRLVIPALHRNIYSDDHGSTWKVQRITTASGAYQEGTSEGALLMANTPDYFVGALVEVNENTGNSDTSHRTIVFRKFNLPWMLNGAPSSRRGAKLVFASVDGCAVCKDVRTEPGKSSAARVAATTRRGVRTVG
jgi:hypothetical protein